MRGQCSNCYHWILPIKPVGRFNKPNIGRCREDGHLAHPSYSCARYRPTAKGLMGYFGITPTERLWLQANADIAVAMRLRQAWRALWREPRDIDRVAAMNLALDAVRAEMRARVLETEMSAGNSAGIDNEHTANVRPPIHDHRP